MERWQRIDTAPPAAAADELRVCCGSPPWIDRMLSRRPFGSLEGAQRAAREEWFALSPAEWKTAFGHHPRIGDIDAARATLGSSAAAASAREQADVDVTDAGVLQALLDGNREYEARFGYIFIVCATGKTAGEMLDLLRSRIRSDPQAEILIAAGEQAKICDLRLAAVV